MEETGMRPHGTYPPIPLCVLVILVAMWPTPAEAKELPLYIGFAYARSERTDSHNLAGFVVGASIVQNSRLRWTSEFGMEFGGTKYYETSPLGYQSGLAQALAHIHLGPELTRRRGRTTLYCHGLVGYGGWILNSFQKPDEGGFSLAAGGGMDIQISSGIALRIIQIDYIPIWLHSDQGSLDATPPLPPAESPTHNLRIGFSLVIGGSF
jgi:hypothetical protein